MTSDDDVEEYVAWLCESEAGVQVLRVRAALLVCIHICARYDYYNGSNSPRTLS